MKNDEFFICLAIAAALSLVLILSINSMSLRWCFAIVAGCLGFVFVAFGLVKSYINDKVL